MAPSDNIGTKGRLDIQHLTAGYGKRTVLSDVSVKLGAGEAIAILGHNGAGKTTLLRTICGLLKPRSGTLRLDDRELGPGYDSTVARDLGMAMIPSEQFVFADLTVEENLRLAARGMPAEQVRSGIDRAFDDYPILAERRAQPAGQMSGGQQRMVSLSMALIRNPSILLLDEPSLGLAPSITQQMLDRVATLVKGGMSVVLVEQNVAAALNVTQRVYVLRGGRILREMPAEELRAMDRQQWWALF